MKSFKEHLNEGMPKGMIAAFDGPKGEVQIFRKGFTPSISVMYCLKVFIPCFFLILLLLHQRLE